MKGNQKAVKAIALAAVLVLFVVVGLIARGDGSGDNFSETFWALIPPIIAIGLALITREVYISLFVGIITGALLYANFNVEGAMLAIFTEGFIGSLADDWNIGILMFLVMLGILVSLVNKAGGSAAYGVWAAKKIKSRTGALLATSALGVLIFVDDYFNCLTVGSVMRPLTDKHNISRAKLAYLIDATAAPICIIAPVSSWAAAVSGVVDNTDGFAWFVRAIPYNFYALLTLAMVLTIALLRFDYGPMKVHEDNAVNKGDLYTTPERPYQNAEAEVPSSKGGIIDLVLPVIVLVVCCVIGMGYTGGLFEGASFVEAFADCDPSIGLVLGAFVALAFTFFFYIFRRILTLTEFNEAISKGFSAMVPAILILVFAWTLSGMTGLLGGAEYVSGLLENSASSLYNFMPVIVFLIACGLSFATGTSWGTFGILLPIAVSVMDPASELMVITISACLAGAVYGDHCSPISDTTIMSSTGAQCEHINHVSTQLPYASLVAAVTAVMYILAGFVQNAFIVLPLALLVMVGVLIAMKSMSKGKQAA
ncbi:MAG: Na+/H+ antiporter NhaC family protein [Clostridiales bacterium]|nr:Na+/H+ antiporter NhaC family protein [Clostridiales bacterium]